MADTTRTPAPAPLEDVGGLVDATRLAAHLGVGTSAVRNWVARDVDWLDTPVGQLSGHVWTREQIEQSLARRKSSPKGGRPKRTTPPDSTTDPS